MAMRRRKLLHAATASLTAVLAGCGGDDAAATETSTPTRTETRSQTATPDESAALLTPVRDLWTAYNDGDVDGVRDAFHPDSADRPTADTAAFAGSVTIDETTVVSRGDDSATVEATLTRTTDDGSETQTHTYELRQSDGEWVIWSIETEPTDSTAPQVSFGFEYDETATTAAETGVLTVTHEGGDTVAADQLSVRGDGIVSPSGARPAVAVSGTTWGGATGDSTVTAGTTLTVGVESDCDLRLVWESADGSAAVTLAAFEGPTT